MSAPRRPEITNLVEIEERREELRRRLRIWHLFLPMTGDDLVAYRSLLVFVKPYRGKLVLSVVFAAVSALFIGLEIALLQGALGKILGAPPTMELVPGSGAPATAPAPVDPPPADTPVADPPADEASGISDWFATKRTEAETWIFKQLGIPPEPEPPPKAARAAPAASRAFDPDEQARRRVLLWLFSGLLVLAVVLASLGKYGQSVIVTSASRRVVRDIRAKLFRHLMGLSVRFHQKNHSAQLVSRITGDLEVFGRFLTEALVRFIQDFFELLAMLIFVAINQGAFIFVIAGVIALAILPVNVISRRLRSGDKKSQAGMAEVATVISEVLVGHRVVKAFVSEQREFDRFRKVTRSHMKKQLAVRRLRSMTEPVIMGIGGLGIAAIIVVGGYRVLDGRLDPTGLLVNVLALVRAMTNLRTMSKQMNDFQLGLAAADRVGTALEVKSEIHEKPDAQPLPPFSREIRFADVHFHHEVDKPTLHGIDLVIRKGEKVALVGPSGAGKTTFIDLVPRFYDVDRGAITIDGLDLRDVTLQSVREQIGIVSQETVLFRDSIRDNIAYGRPDATDEEIVAAARAANAHDFIEHKPDGYQTLVGERGVHLSGGERQRLAIARALLRDPPILILDEATSALDSESESVVQAALQRLMQGRTVIVIAHRLSTIRDADRIVVLEKGRIAEIGAHDELMRRPDGIYRRHYEIQSRTTSGRSHPAAEPSPG